MCRHITNDIVDVVTRIVPLHPFGDGHHIVFGHSRTGDVFVLRPEPYELKLVVIRAMHVYSMPSSTAAVFGELIAALDSAFSDGIGENQLMPLIRNARWYVEHRAEISDERAVLKEFGWPVTWDIGDHIESLRLGISMNGVSPHDLPKIQECLDAIEAYTRRM